MNAKILGFRRGRHRQHTNQFLLELEESNSKEKAIKFVGKKVVWKSPAGKEIVGKISDIHGSKGVLRARFNRGLPGQAVGGHVEVVNN